MKCNTTNLFRPQLELRKVKLNLIKRLAIFNKVFDIFYNTRDDIPIFDTFQYRLKMHFFVKNRCWIFYNMSIMQLDFFQIV